VRRLAGLEGGAALSLGLAITVVLTTYAVWVLLLYNEVATLFICSVIAPVLTVRRLPIGNRRF
jgi:hypothetical protein